MTRHRSTHHDPHGYIRGGSLLFCYGLPIALVIGCVVVALDITGAV